MGQLCCGEITDWVNDANHSMADARIGCRTVVKNWVGIIDCHTPSRHLAAQLAFKSAERMAGTSCIYSTTKFVSSACNKDDNYNNNSNRGVEWDGNFTFPGMIAMTGSNPEKNPIFPRPVSSYGMQGN